MPKLMLNSGLRLSEATALRWKNIDLLTGKLIAQRGKGAKDCTLWIGENNIDKLLHWRQRQVKVCKGEPQYVFTTLKEKPLQDRYVQAMLARCIERVGINKSISPHSLRHTFATDLYRETGKIRLVQKVLGHANLSTTMIYTHIHDPEVAEALKSFRQATAVAV